METILLYLAGGRYVVPLPTATTAEIVSGRSGRGGGGDSGVGGVGGSVGGDDKVNIGRGRGAGQGGSGAGTGGARGAKRVHVRYEAHMPTLYLQESENLRTILEGMVLPTVRGHVICKK